MWDKYKATLLHCEMNHVQYCDAQNSHSDDIFYT